MILYIPKSVDIYNSHLKNLIDAYIESDVQVGVGYETFIYGNLIPNVMHFHMVEHLLGFMNYDQDLFFKKLEFFKKCGTKFIFTAHNLFPHRNLNQYDYLSFFQKFFQHIDLFTHHGQQSIEIFKVKFSLQDREHIVCPHGDYLKDIQNFDESQIEAKRLLKLPEDKKVILVFGRLQFKNLKFAHAVLDRLKKSIKGCYILLAGINPLFRYNDLNHIYNKLNNEILNKFRVRRRILNKRFSNYDTYLLFKSADVVFLPHNSGLTSGIIPLAATIGKPFVYPNIGVFAEQAKFCKCEEYECSNVEQAYKAIMKLLSTSDASFDNTIWLANNSWNDHVKLILNKIKNLGWKY